ncbi:MAG: hypothetical protein KC493_18005 [Bacteriovoracaceae bacterium]|nr:hypothetical protein [Bacteriovoracaceae bacterium]
MGKRSATSGLANYLSEAPFDHSLNLTPNGYINFHWANWKPSCDFVKKQVKADSETHKQKLVALSRELEKLKKKTIWLKNKRKTLKSSMYDLYESYLDPRIRMTWFDREDEILVSTHNESGPYITLSSMRWMEKDTFASFVRRKLITDFVPQRSFRVGLDIPVSVSFDNSPLTKTTFHLNQASESGLVIKVSSLSDITKALNSQVMYVSMNLQPFHQNLDTGFHEIIKAFSEVDFEDREIQEKEANFTLNSSVLRDYGNYDNIKASDGKSFYIFVKYEDLIGLNPEGEVKDIFNSFVGKVEKQLQKEMKKVA